MPGQRGVGARRSRGSWAVRIAGAALVLVVAATVVSVLVLTQGTARARRQSAPSLPRNVIGTPLTIGLVNPGPPPQRDSRPVPELLHLSATGLAFTASGGAGHASPAEEWTAAQMGGGTYILIYAPDGRCLTGPASAGPPAATLAKCNLSSSQRWRHQFVGKDTAGRDGWRLRNAADGQCLTAVQVPLGGQPGESGVGLSACRSSHAAWRQFVSFQTAY